MYLCAFDFSSTMVEFILKFLGLVGVWGSNVTAHWKLNCQAPWSDHQFHTTLPSFIN